MKSNENDSKELKEFRQRLISIVSDVSMETLRNAFDLIDLNGDGELQKSEFLEGCNSMKIELNKEELETVFKCIDTDGSGEIDFNEFAEFLQPKKQNAAFKQFGQFRQKLMKLLHSNSYDDYYHFKVNNNIILKLFNGKSISVGNADELKSDEIQEIDSQFITEIIDNGKKTYLQSAKNGKYIKIVGDKIVFGGTVFYIFFIICYQNITHFRGILYIQIKMKMHYLK